MSDLAGDAPVRRVDVEETAIPGLVVVTPRLLRDERGFFARTWCADEFAAHGLGTSWSQFSISFNERRGTLRGMHYQAAPFFETKLVRCTTGAIYDVVVDLRPESPAYKRWIAIELSATNHKAVYIPEGCVHGFQTLEDATEVFYQISRPYVATAARGVRWNDPAFGIEWPAAERTISVRDQQFADFEG